MNMDINILNLITNRNCLKLDKTTYMNAYIISMQVDKKTFLYKTILLLPNINAAIPPIIVSITKYKVGFRYIKISYSM